jgi:hypothetical protein
MGKAINVIPSWFETVAGACRKFHHCNKKTTLVWRVITSFLYKISAEKVLAAAIFLMHKPGSFSRCEKNNQDTQSK